MTKVEEALAQMEQMLEKPPHVKTASEIATLFAATGEIAAAAQS